SEPLGFRWAAFSAAFTLLMPAFALPRPPLGFPPQLHRRGGRSPTIPSCRSSYASAASVDRLSPGTLSAQRHSTSELLRTLSRMAASGPTSWLSAQRHSLAH